MENDLQVRDVVFELATDNAVTNGSSFDDEALLAKNKVTSLGIFVFVYNMLLQL